MTTHSQMYVEYIYTGSLVADSSSAKIASAADVHLPKSACGYRTFERTETTTDDGEVLIGAPRNYSAWTYLGREKTLPEVEQEHPGQRILIDNMRINGYKRVVFTPYGNVWPLNDADVVVAP